MSLSKREFHERTLRREAERQGVTIWRDGAVWHLQGRYCDISTCDLLNVRPDEIRPPAPNPTSYARL